MQLADAKVFTPEITDKTRYNPKIEQKSLRSQVESFQSNILAQNAVASMYERGEGVEIDLKEAFKYYKLAAHGGVLPAFFSLGTISYEVDICVESCITLFFEQEMPMHMEGEQQ